MIVRLENISKSYRNSLGNINRVVLNDLNLNVAKGSKVALMGPSGSGKTTLLHLMGTLDTPDKGAYYLDGQLVDHLSEKAILNIRNHKIGFVFQFHHLLPQCTLLENVLLPTLTQKGNKSQQKLKAEELLRYMGIWEQRNNKPAELSGGECQRAAVARALINSPEMLLADEPTGSLDTQNANLLLDLLLAINETYKVTLVVATHADLVADKMDQVYELKEGQIDLRR